MVDELTMNALIAISDKIGIAATEITHIFIEAQPKIAMVDITMMVIFIVLTIAITIVVTYLDYKKNNWFDESVPVITAIVTMCVLGILMIFITPSIYCLVAPEYMGLKDLLVTLT